MKYRAYTGVVLYDFVNASINPTNKEKPKLNIKDDEVAGAIKIAKLQLETLMKQEPENLKASSLRLQQAIAYDNLLEKLEKVQMRIHQDYTPNLPPKPTSVLKPMPKSQVPAQKTSPASVQRVAQSAAEAPAQKKGWLGSIWNKTVGALRGGRSA